MSATAALAIPTNPEPQPTAEDTLRALWQRKGILAINPIDIEDRFIRERLGLIGIALYGRRGVPPQAR